MGLSGLGRETNMGGSGLLFDRFPRVPRDWAIADMTRCFSISHATVSVSAGDRVTHDKFGLGTVVSTSGAGEKAEATIDFGAEGTKRLLLRYAPVEKL